MVLSEFRRVLRPGGMLVISTLNREGMSFGEVPWQVHRPRTPVSLDVRKILDAVGIAALSPRDWVARYRNWWGHRLLAEDHGDWAIAPLAKHGFTLMAHFTSLAAARQEMLSAGFELLATYDGSSGLPISAEALDSVADCFYLVARRPPIDDRP
ncbi:MAG: hypothetical protein ACYCV7_06510 [Acidimicrobiales bacterium]